MGALRSVLEKARELSPNGPVRIALHGLEAVQIGWGCDFA